MRKQMKLVGVAILSGAALFITSPAMAKIGVSKNGTCYYKNEAGNLNSKSCSDPDVTCRVMDPGIDDCKIAGMPGPFFYSDPVASADVSVALPAQDDTSDMDMPSAGKPAAVMFEGPYKGKVVAEKEATSVMETVGDETDTDVNPPSKDTRYERERPARPKPRMQRR